MLYSLFFLVYMQITMKKILLVCLFVFSGALVATGEPTPGQKENVQGVPSGENLGAPDSAAKKSYMTEKSVGTELQTGQGVQESTPMGQDQASGYSK